MRNIGIIKPPKLAKLVLHLNIMDVKKLPLSDHIRKEVWEYFREDVEKLSDLIDRDLSHWK